MGAMGARQESIIYRRAHGAALGAPPWSTTHDTFIVTDLAPVLEVLLIAVHSLPPHYPTARRNWSPFSGACGLARNM
jgi:hypothetical protein